MFCPEFLSFYVWFSLVTNHEKHVRSIDGRHSRVKVVYLLKKNVLGKEKIFLAVSIARRFCASIFLLSSWKPVPQ